MAGKSSELGRGRRQHPVDVLVGKRIRMRRITNAQSQNDLAKALGLTFQQVQKYEKGTNRVSCSRLFEIARILDAPISYFFGDDGSNTDARAAEQFDLGDLKDGMRLINAFGKLDNHTLRRKFIDLLESIAAPEKAARGR